MSYMERQQMRLDIGTMHVTERVFNMILQRLVFDRQGNALLCISDGTREMELSLPPHQYETLSGVGPASPTVINEMIDWERSQLE